MIQLFVRFDTVHGYWLPNISSLHITVFKTVKRLSLLFLLCATSLLISATARLSTEPTTYLSPMYAQPAIPLPQSEADATLRWFMRWDGERIRTVAVPILSQFRAEQPRIRIVLENVENSSDYYQELRSQIERGSLPDILYLATAVANELNQQGLLLPLDRFLQQDAPSLDGYDNTLLDLYRNESGQLYCLPVDMATLAVVYNRDLFDEANVDYPQNSWDWEEFLAVAAATTRDGNADGDLDDEIDRYGVDRFYHYWPVLIWSWAGHNVFDDPRRPTAFLLEEEDSVNALQWLADLHTQHGVMPSIGGTEASSHADKNLFLAGRAAMQITGYWQLPHYLATGLPIAIAPLPTGEHTVNRNDGSCLAIGATTLFPQKAWTFLTFLIGSDGIGAHMLRGQAQQTPTVAALYAHSLFVNPFNLSATRPKETDTGETDTGEIDTDAPLNDELKRWFASDSIKTYPLYDPFYPLYNEWQQIADEELPALWNGASDADSVVGQLANAAENLIEDLPAVSAQPHPDSMREQSLSAGQPLARLSITDTFTTSFATLFTIPHMIPVTHTSPMTDILVIDQSMNVSAISSTLAITANSAQRETLEIGEKGSSGLPPENDWSRLSAPTLPHHYFVAPSGDNSNSGLHRSVPLATLQYALDLVAPGDTIHLAAGNYNENVTTTTAGIPQAPITITGPPDAILRGNGSESAAFYLTHNYYTLTGFTIDGLYGDPMEKEGYTQKLLYVQGMGEKEGVTGLRVLQMQFRNAGGECIRLRYFAQKNEIAYSTFHVCGLLDFVFDNGGKNGEAIYIGTAANQWADGKNPTTDPDESSSNWIHHNEMDTQGNECVEVKEGGYGNIIEFNLCTGQLDPDSAGIGARGNRNVIRYNTVYSNVGAGVRLGGHEVDNVQYGIDNLVYGNYLLTNIAGGVKIINEPQRRICGNYLRQNLGKQAFGASSDGYDPAAPC